MKLTLFQIDAFAEKVFSGNPAAVVPLDKWLPDDVMQNIAMENNLSETAFFIPDGEGFYIRWFTPVTEVNLCGHATLATGHLVFNHLGFNGDEIIFQSKSGILKVKRQNDLIFLDFPASKLNEIPLPDKIENAFGILPEKCFDSINIDDLMMVFDSEQIIQELQPDFEFIKKLESRGIIVTSKSTKYDFVSRFFAPAVGIHEDPVTGSAHTLLIPYWSKELNKTELTAKQISKRGGVLHCKNKGERVEIGGKAFTYLKGEIKI
jgi:PhzF family phenazine biosynthesis protein